MKRIVLALTIATAAALGSVGAASAWERNTTIETERGTIRKSVDVHCDNGACYRDSELTGVNGGTVKRSGMCERAGYSSWHCKGTITGPNGNSRSRHVRIYAY